MRRLILTLLLAFPLMTSAAFAASNSGTVSAINTRTGILQFTDGASYYVPDRTMLSHYRQGDRVRVQYERRQGTRIVDDILKTGGVGNPDPIVTPTRDVGVQKNFMSQKSKMCDPTPTDRDPCYDIGGQ